ncbi:hypothetical protein BU15DRAFT_51851, partial [Melanogaster broomeanus]
LLQEEMRRVLAFLEWHASWWESQAFRRTDLDAVVVEGLSAYAFRHAHIRRTMHDAFQALWTDPAPDGPAPHRGPACGVS